MTMWGGDYAPVGSRGVSRAWRAWYRGEISYARYAELAMAALEAEAEAEEAEAGKAASETETEGVE